MLVQVETFLLYIDISLFTLVGKLNVLSCWSTKVNHCTIDWMVNESLILIGCCFSCRTGWTQEYSEQQREGNTANGSAN